MDHVEKDIKKMWHHKDVIVLVVSVISLVLSITAICISMDGHEGRGGEGGGYGRMMNENGNRQGMYYNDNNQNPNDGEYADDMATGTNATSSKR